MAYKNQFGSKRYRIHSSHALKSAYGMQDFRFQKALHPNLVPKDTTGTSTHTDLIFFKEWFNTCKNLDLLMKYLLLYAYITNYVNIDGAFKRGTFMNHKRVLITNLLSLLISYRSFIISLSLF